MADLKHTIKRALPTEALQRFLKMESSGGIILVAAAVVALIIANIPGLSQWYDDILHAPFVLRLGEMELEKDVLHMINDGLMAIFFLLVALEIKREMLEGDLASPAQIVLPAAAAAGGVILPAAIYAAINWTDKAGIHGWAIPAATDIAFSLGVLALLGHRAPSSLKIFLTTVAVVDDLAAIVIIAIFYTQNLSILSLGLALAGFVMLILLNRMRVRALEPYFLVGLFMWHSVLQSGVHATLAGVALGFCIPLRTSPDDTYSPLHFLENRLHPWVIYAILPIFAFANAGVDFRGISASVFTHPVTLGIVAGLVIGKPLGVFGGAFLAIKAGKAALPPRANWASLFGVCTLAGIGFTMSLFIGTLAFTSGQDSLDAATRIGVFGGSILAALAGLVVLHMALPKNNYPPEKKQDG